LEHETSGAQVRAHPTNYFLKETAITVPEPAIAIRIDEFRGILPENSV
jgi:hypothetical protein